MDVDRRLAEGRGDAARHDNDTAGQEGTARLVETLGSRVIPVALPLDVKDPAELAPLPDGEALFATAIREAFWLQGFVVFVTAR